REGHRTFTPRDYDYARRRRARENLTGENPFAGRRAQSLVRSDSDRRPQPSNPPHVSEYRFPGGKNQTCPNRSAETRRAAWKSSPADSARSGTIKSPDARAFVAAALTCRLDVVAAGLQTGAFDFRVCNGGLSRRLGRSAGLQLGIFN